MTRMDAIRHRVIGCAEFTLHARLRTAMRAGGAVCFAVLLLLACKTETGSDGGLCSPGELDGGDHCPTKDASPGDLGQQPSDSSVDATRDAEPCTDDDGDSDGVSECDGDCDDADGNVYPGQLTFFVVANLRGNFDYDCDEEEEPEYPSIAQCDTVWGPNPNFPAMGPEQIATSCTFSEGWDAFNHATVPACGTSGFWQVNCSRCDHWMDTGCGCTDRVPPESRDQGCR